MAFQPLEKYFLEECELPFLKDPHTHEFYQCPVLVGSGTNTYSAITLEELGWKDPETDEPAWYTPQLPLLLTLDGYYQQCVVEKCATILANGATGIKDHLDDFSQLLAAVLNRDDLAACVDARTTIVELFKELPKRRFIQTLNSWDDSGAAVPLGLTLSLLFELFRDEPQLLEWTRAVYDLLIEDDEQYDLAILTKNQRKSDVFMKVVVKGGFIEEFRRLGGKAPPGSTTMTHTTTGTTSSPLGSPSTSAAKQAATPGVTASTPVTPGSILSPSSSVSPTPSGPSSTLVFRDFSAIKSPTLQDSDIVDLYKIFSNVTLFYVGSDLHITFASPGACYAAYSVTTERNFTLKGTVLVPDRPDERAAVGAPDPNAPNTAAITEIVVTKSQVSDRPLVWELLTDNTPDCPVLSLMSHMSLDRQVTETHVTFSSTVATMLACCQAVLLSITTSTTGPLAENICKLISLKFAKVLASTCKIALAETGDRYHVASLSKQATTWTVDVIHSATLKTELVPGITLVGHLESSLAELGVIVSRCPPAVTGTNIYGLKVPTCELLDSDFEQAIAILQAGRYKDEFEGLVTLDDWNKRPLLRKVSQDGAPLEASTEHGKIIAVRLGRIEECEVDGIVNPTNSKFENNGSVSEGIRNACGGPGWEERCRGSLAGVPAGHAKVCEAGQATAFKHVVHAFGPSADDSDHMTIVESSNHLRIVTFHILEEADKAQLTSLAIPAISTGELGYFEPRECAKMMVEEVLKYLYLLPSSSLRLIMFCSIESVTTEAFEAELATYMPKPAQKF